MSGILQISMRRRLLLSAMSVSLWSAVMPAQQAPATALSAAQRSHIEKEQFQIITSVRGLPLGVRDELQKLFGSQTLDIAEPGAEFQATDVLRGRLPIRRLAAAGCSADFHCLVYYERGGIAHTWQAALFRWTPDATRLEFAGAAPGGLSTIEDVKKAMLSGAIKSPVKIW